MSVTQELRQAAPCAASVAPTRPLRVFLAAPYAPRGGGMGRMMEYLLQAPVHGVVFEKMESRGGGSAAASCGFVLRAAWRLMGARLAGTPAAIHVNMAEGSSVFRKGVLLLLARALGMQAVLHLHAANIIGYYGGLPGPARLLVRVIFRNATVCLVLGEPWRVFLQAQLRVPAARIEVLRNGVPRPSLYRFPRPGADFCFVFLGNLLPRKGLADLLHAAADPVLAQARWSLVIAGGGDDTRLHRLAFALGIQGRVTFAGWLDRDDTNHLLARADALVLPSYHEALPLVLAEAAAMALPIIATPVGAIPELFRDGESALLVQPGDRRALARAMLRVAATPALEQGLGRQARLIYERDLTLERFVDGLISVYDRHCRLAHADASP